MFRHGNNYFWKCSILLFAIFKNLSVIFFYCSILFTVEWSTDEDFKTIKGEKIVMDVRNLQYTINGLEKVDIVMVFLGIESSFV